MQRVLHETCQRYLERRLSEGWGEVCRYRNTVFISPPDGSFIRPVNLLNDVETLRPNAAGDETSINTQHPASDAHWDKVDEAAADDWDTYVYHYDDASWGRDLYNIQDHAIGSGTINSVTVFAKVDRYSVATDVLKIACKTGGTVYESDVITLANFNTWYVKSNQWATNPGGGAWTWAQIDALQVGINLLAAPGYYTACTQVYVEVDYTPAVTEKTSSDTGSGVDTKATGNPLATQVRAETGSGADTKSTGEPQAQLIKAETGSGADALVSLVVPKTSSDSGTGTDARETGSPEVSHERTETGGGVEAKSLSASLVKAEVGAGADATILIALIGSDSGAGVEALVALLATLTKTETGSGAESLGDRDLVLTETGAGVDAGGLVVVEKFSSDSGVGSDNLVQILVGVILRPIAVGDLEELWSACNPAYQTGYNWNRVDEETPDDDTTYVGIYGNQQYGAFFYDLYNFPSLPADVGLINYIRAHYRCKTTGDWWYAKPAAKINGTIYDGATIGYPDFDTSWENHYHQWDESPDTEEDWTKDEVNGAQFGLALSPLEANYASAYNTQIYLEVVYVKIIPRTSSDTGSGTDVLAEAQAILERAETGSGAESIGDRDTVLTETGSGAESLGDRDLVLTETGAGVDAVVLLAWAKFASDAGLGIDASISLLAALLADESGEGLEAIISRFIAAGVESGAGVDASVLQAAQVVADAGLGVDARVSLLAAITKSETGTGVDQIIGLATNRILSVDVITTLYRNVKPLTTHYRNTKLLTTRYRTIEGITTHYRKVDPITTHYRKVKAFTARGK